MARVIIGAVVATIAMFFIGFIFFATPLARLGTASLEDPQAAAVQQAMAANLPRTGTYTVPGVDTRAQTNMYSRGPIATVHYNTGGFAAFDPATLVKGLVLNFLVALLIGAALIGIDRRVPEAQTFAPTTRPRVFACGPTAFVETVATTLVDLGHAPSSIRLERFGGSGNRS